MVNLVPGITPQPQPRESQSVRMPNPEQAIANAAKILDTEVMAMTADLKKLQQQSESKQAQQSNNSKQALNPKASDELAAYLAGLLIEESDKKQQKKKTSWEEKMAELAQLEGAVDDTHLQPEEKGIVREFFDNMARIKQLRQRLKQLDQKEDYVKEQIKRQQRANGSDQKG